jgi:hypothetical protein
MGENDRPHVRVGLVNADEIGLPDVPGVELPTVEEHYYTLDDDDAGECRGIYQSELDEAYVDNHIDSIRILLPDLWSNIDDQILYLTYEHGLAYEVQLGHIDFGGGAMAQRFRKSGGLIFPSDDYGTQYLLNATNTPNLVAIREHVHDEWRKVQQKRLQIAEIVYSFAQVMTKYSSLDASPADVVEPGESWTE